MTETDCAVAAVLAREARGMLTIAEGYNRDGGHEELVQWMMVTSSRYACEAVRLDPSLGQPLDVVTHSRSGRLMSLAEMAVGERESR